LRRIKFEKTADNDYKAWCKSSPKICKRIKTLIKVINETPTEGLGKPELLKRDYKGHWSRRINEQHRLVYKFTETEIIIVQCKYHYKKT